ncbi:hypothetical protein [Marivirga arenosa]|uniref:DUF1772 domain-containing protein n=1 Tax=Marivirga arenosa TaxID=3059076 RepID=A0AA49GIQ8_9BACT|nr:hypothetical protein [Marivirga sp. BKB1-2]WKK80498.1 hypothetical protein QYS47_25735 [Marivirga sp. BKB1-2]
MTSYIKELSDFGLFVLIWIVQLIVYPSFTMMEKSNLLAWHPKYTQMITIIVMPLMLVQIILTLYLTYSNSNWILITQSVLVVMLWASTFFQAVPLHNLIESNQEVAESAKKLVQVNWNRTAMWTIIVLLNLVQRFTTFNN